MSDSRFGLTSHQWQKLENAARRWFFDGVPTDYQQLHQLLVYTTIDADVAEVHRQIVEANAQAFDDYVEAFCRLVERHANGEDAL
jgi:hypothetical protein